MAYSNGYAVAIMVGGRVVDEMKDGVVAVPFGADYAIRLINKTNRRALARVYIDDQSVTGNGGLVVHAAGDRQGGDVVTLERPIDKPVTFRFASTESASAAEHGKGGPDTDGTKGLVRVEWTPEREILPCGTGYLGAMQTKRLHDYSPSGGQYTNSSSLRAPRGNIGSPASFNFTEEKTGGGIVMPDAKTLAKSGTELQSGVTVEGNYSNQQFQYVRFDVDYSASPTVVLLKLKGYVAEEGIPAAGTAYCPSCRTRTKKSTDRYCRQCGERL